MSFLGKVLARCPKGCEPFDAEIWSFINRASAASLRESLLGGDLNLVSCPECGALFYPEATVVYLDAPAGLLAFVFPEAYEAEKERWRTKMAEDYAQMKTVLRGKDATDAEPALYFGMDAFRRVLEQDDELADEVEIAAVLCRDLKLAPFFVQRKWARDRGLPWLLPSDGPTTLESIRLGLKKLLKANDRLKGYERWEAVLESASSLPPGSQKK